MNNATKENIITNNVFRRYLLGESLKNSFIRFTVILSAIILVWGGIILALIIYMKCQRTRQMVKSSTTHHLYDSEMIPAKNSSKRHLKRNRRFDSLSSSSILSSRCFWICRILLQLKQYCSFRPSSPIVNEQRVKQSSLIRKRQDLLRRHSYATTNKIQITVETTNRRLTDADYITATIGGKLSFYHETDNSSGDELKNLYRNEDDSQAQSEITCKTSNVVQLVEPKRSVCNLSLSLPTSDNSDDGQTTERLQKLHDFNTRATLLFHPVTRRLSNTKCNSCLPPINTIQKQQRKSLLVVSSARELSSENKWKWKHSLVNDPIIRDTSITASAKQLPLVMITDTSSSNTNIVELETYEDNHRLMSDLEKRLSRQLRASYRPRHST